MKKILITSIILVSGWTATSQVKELSDPIPYFSAIIVADMDSSLSWYTSMLGYDLLDEKEFKEMNFRQANLRRGNAALELIELGNSVDPATAISGYNTKSKLRGIFKIGFMVSDFDKWLNHLVQSKAEFHGNVVSDPITGKRMVIIRDPDGNRIQLFEK